MWVKSTRLGLSGKLDLLIDSPEGLFPVDFKVTIRRPHRNHVMQLCGYYARLLEDCYRREVTKGFFYLIPQNDSVLFDLTDAHRLPGSGEGSGSECSRSSSAWFGKETE